MKIKAILTDVGGVLVRAVNADKKREWEKRLNLEPGELTKIVHALKPASLATLGLVSSNQTWGNIGQRFLLSAGDLSRLQTDFGAGNVVNKDFFNYLKRIRENYLVAIFSNAWDDARNIYTQKYHLDEITDKMIISSEVGMVKPDEEFYKYALDLLLVKPEETLFIDDSIENIATAEAMGIKTVVFEDTAKAIGEIKGILSQ